MSGEESVRIAFQGVPGAYSEEAARRAVGTGEPAAGVRTRPRPSFRDVFDAVADGRADLGIVPVENSLAGSVRANYDLLLERDLVVVGEVYLRVRHCLMALPGTGLGDVEVVLSHPQALSQCEVTLRELLPGAERRAASDTAGSARRIRRERLRSTAALASRRAAEAHDLRILRRGMEDHEENHTRFLLLGTEPVDPGPSAKTSIVFSGPDGPGLLHRCLGAFARRGVDLTKIESRPLSDAPWEYVFYLDLRGSDDDEAVREALDELAGATTFLRTLGSYPTGSS